MSNALAAAPSARPVLPLLLSVRDARQMLGIGHTKTYELLKAGQLRARKLGGRTMIESSSVVAFVEQLPAARFS